ncbi:glycosyltransferase family 2 protein [Paludisphaera borealis]|uniref:GT2 family glycosyltransferase n=1 Tax=Paludisphaera borealis TaxID=1387353 RepID=A0A1U7CLZ7_9BACT|nr:glycosyltransferase family 2 protein [Paludisphaera borealis]APW59903.1 GT2 family glycosyltransferase [Paludisphaera borealis]
MSRVDVIIPCYRYAHFLRGCVESVLSQSGPDVRILIIDDFSPDHTFELAAGLAAEDGRVEFRRHENNKGHIATFNEGLNWSEGDYTLLLSADDLLAPGALARAVGLMDAYPEVGFVYGRVVRFETDRAPIAPDSDLEPFGWKVIGGSEWLAQQCAYGFNRIASPEVVVRTELQHRLGGYLVELPHTGDLEMWLRLAAHSSVGYVDADQAFYRSHQHNMHKALAAETLSQLLHHKAAYDQFFRRCADHLSDGDALRRSAFEVLAREALGCSHEAFLGGDLGASEKLLRFAKSTDPGVVGTKIYSRMKWKIRIGPTVWSHLRRLSRRDPIASAMRGVGLP